MASLPRFHNRTGALVSLSNDGRTAQRNHPTQEFNNGVVLSSVPLKDDQVLEVKIDKKVNSWSGSIEIGVTTCEPDNLNFPISATGFRDGTWVMSGSSVLKDGHSMIEEYGCDLDQLSEGDVVGVMRSANGELHFFVNGVDQGSAATDIPPNVYAVIDMYGKCAQVSIIESTDNRVSVHQLANEFLAQLSSQIVNDISNTTEALTLAEGDSFHSNERLTFHERCGSLVKLSNGRRTGERCRPLDEFNNGVVMTNRPLKDGELFEIRLDHLVDKWSGSIEVGITTHNPSAIDFPATMTNMRSGTIMMSGCGILTNGKGTRREYGQYNLDALAEGDRIGLIRKTNGSLHYFINGVDQGMASNTCPQTVWGVVDLYGMAVKVTILDRNDPNYHHMVNSRGGLERQRVPRQVVDLYDEEVSAEEEVERLCFHTRCGTHAAVVNSGQTAHRPNALDDFNNGVVLTNRFVRPNEVFEVRIDKMVDKWAGSIEIGLTLHTPENLEFPSTMTNIRSGTWMMTGNGVMYNGTTVMDDYGQNLDRLKAGDRVGVVRKDSGTVHFFVNGIDQGSAASNVPENVYGVIDLYGQAAQATIVDQSDSLSIPDMDFSSLADSDYLMFHRLHGSNSAISSGGLTALRPNATGEFNDAIVISSRPLKDNELFEVVIERMVDRWSGSIEAGVTLIKPEDLEFPNTMTDIEYDTWMLSGSAIMQDGSTIRNGYPLDLDSVNVGCRIGMMRCSDATLHYFLNGNDQGVACSDIPPGVFAVIDLYGQCAQVSITSVSGILPTDNNAINRAVAEHTNFNSPVSTAESHRFSHCCGKGITLSSNSHTATRNTNFNHGLIFSSDPLKKDEMFEIRIEKLSNQWSGSLRIGLTSMAISDTSPTSILPGSALELTTKPTWIVCGTDVKKSGVTIKENYAPSLERLSVGNKVGIRRSHDGTMHLYLNGENLGIAASNIPKNVFAVIDLYGMVESVSVVSSVVMVTDSSSTTPSVESETGHQISLPVDRDQDQDTTSICVPEFHCNHGKNILLSNSNQTIERVASYNQGVAVTNKPLVRNHLFRVRIDKLNNHWSSSLMIGYLGFSPEKYTFPVSAIAIKKSCVVIQADQVFSCGSKIKEHYGCNLDKLQVGHTVGILLDDDNSLHIYVNGIDQGVAVRDVPTPCHALIDLYGQCEKVTIVSDDNAMRLSQPNFEDREKADLEDGMFVYTLYIILYVFLMLRNSQYSFPWFILLFMFVFILRIIQVLTNFSVL
ncbi:Neuralized-like protein 4 [Mactra antiquata]